LRVKAGAATEKGAEGGPAGRRWAAAAALLVVLTTVAYLPAIRAGFIWDDDAYVTSNQTLRSVEGLRRIWFEVGAVPQYYPLVHTTFWVEYRLWGTHPMGYHLVNVLLHGLSAVLLWRALRRLAVPGAWMAAAVFALHPVQVESVAWITERKNVLSGFLYLAAALAYLRFDARRARAAEGAQPEGRSSPWGLYVLALALFGGALLSKTTAATLPAALLVILWWRRGRAPWSEVPLLAPFFALGIGLGLHTAWLERTLVGASGPEWDLSWVDRSLVAGRALWFYAGKLIWPSQLTFLYPRWEIDAAATFLYPRWEIDAAAAWQYLFPLSALAVGLALWALRGRIGRGPAAAVMFFAGTLFPALGFFDVFPMQFSFVADHFQYLASIGLIVLAVAGVARFLSSRISGGARGMAAVVLLILGALTWSQAGAYRDLETLWRDTLRKNPRAWLAHNNLGNVLADRGDLAGAVEAFSRAVEVKPDYAMAYFNRGTAQSGLGRVDDALADLDRALEIDPQLAEALVNRALIREGRGETQGALEDYRRALEIAPWSAAAHSNLGNLYRKLGQGDRALVEYDEALRLDPAYAKAWNNRGSLRVEQGDFLRAIDDFDEALRLDPGLAAVHKNRGLAHANLGRYAEAIDDFGRALEINPGDPESHLYRGLSHLKRGEWAPAVADFTEALRLRPGYAQALYNRAIAHREAGDLERARQDVRSLQALGHTVPPELRSPGGS
jgi:tetratricopeptide (TPR) repeat protein